MSSQKEESQLPGIDKESIRNLNAFKDIEESNLINILDHGKIIYFKEGWPLSNIDEINSKIYFILNGNARLIGINNDKLFTIIKLKQGDPIGLASLLRGDSCEQVSSSTELIFIFLNQ